MKKININNFEEKLYYEKLPSGLKVYLIPNKKLEDFACFFTTHFGSCDIKFKVDGKEVNVPTGIAHFLEHKVFDRKDNPFDFYSNIGCDVNAFTSKNVTSFHFSGNSNFKKGFKYLLDFVTDFHITKKLVEKEKGIIMEEANMYKDNYYDLLDNEKNKNLFNVHPYKEKIIGKDKDILSATKKDLEVCYDSFYRPDNMFIIVTGNFNIKDAMSIIKDIKFNTSNKKIEKITYNEKDKVKKGNSILKTNIEIPLAGLYYKINKNKFDLDPCYVRYYLNMYLTLLFENLSIFYEENYKKGTFYNIYTESELIEDHYILSIEAKTKVPDKFLKEAEKHMKDIKFKEEDFERIKKLWIAGEVRIINNIKSTAYNIIEDEIHYKEFKNNKIKDIKSLSFDEFNKIIKDIDLSNVSRVVISRKV